MSIQAVLFDLGDTLVGTSLNAFETFCTILERNSITVTVKEVEKAFAVAEKELNNPFAAIGKLPYLEFYRRWDMCVLKALGITRKDLAKTINEQWFDISGVTLFPDVNFVLQGLKRKRMKTGIISNAYEEEIYRICTRVGLDGFDIYVGSDTVHKPKPDPAIFVYALEQLGVEPEEAVFVGDDLERDYRAAERVGMHPLLLVRGTGDIPKGVRHIRSLTALQDLVDESSEEGVRGNTGHRAVNSCHLHRR